MNLDSEVLNRIGRRYGMWDPCSTPESEKNKESEIWLKARPEMKTHCVRADSSQALTSDSRSFVFLTDSSKSQGSHIPYLLCILSGRNSRLFPFSKADVPFAIPHKTKPKGSFTGKHSGWTGRNPDVKAPLCLVLWGIAKGISGLRNRKAETRSVFGCAFQKMGTGDSDDSGMSLEK